MNKSFEEGNIFWDTTLDPLNYPKEIKIIFFKSFFKNRKKFANWIGSLAYKNFNNINDLIKLPLSRDPYISDLFKNILILNVLKSVQIRKKIKTIVFDSKATARTFLSLNKKNEIKIIVKRKKIQTLNILKSFIFSLLIFIFVKILKKKTYFYEKKIVLFNTYLSCETHIKDHVFPELKQIFYQARMVQLYLLVVKLRQL